MPQKLSMSSRRTFRLFGDFRSVKLALNTATSSCPGVLTAASRSSDRRGLRLRQLRPQQDGFTCASLHRYLSQATVRLLDFQPAGRIADGVLIRASVPLFFGKSEVYVSESLSNTEADERFFVLGRMEILNLLNDLILRREPVTLSFDDGKECYVTTLLEARPKNLIFEQSPDEDANARLLKSRTSFFVARPDGIRVQFLGTQAKRMSWGGSPALSVPLPERMVRLQRQESYRILIPVAKALMVTLYDQDGSSLGEWPLHDLSVGGVGATMIGEPRLELGQTIARVSLLLPELGGIDCSVTLRHSTGLANDEVLLRYRIGLGFSGLLPAMRAAIQRYIIKLEQERRGMPPMSEADVV
ncbi:hypothetical protein BH11PSE11_BH11PSE11_31840 [soil metagenome]